MGRVDLFRIICYACGMITTTADEIVVSLRARRAALADELAKIDRMLEAAGAAPVALPAPLPLPQVPTVPFVYPTFATQQPIWAIPPQSHFPYHEIWCGKTTGTIAIGDAEAWVNRPTLPGYYAS